MGKYKRKKFFINKRLQIRYMITLLIPMLILIIFIGLVMYYSQYKFLHAATKEMSKDIKNTIITNQIYVEEKCERNSKIVQEIKQKLDEYYTGEKGFSSSLLKIAYKILFLGLCVVIIEIAFLTIFISHKVAGPIYRLEKYSEDLRNGNFTSRIFLRKGDELTDTADHFNKTGETIKKRFEDLFDLNQKLIEEAKNGNTDKIQKLEQHFKDIKKSIKI